MRRSKFSRKMVIVVFVTAVVCISRNVAAQAAKPATPKTAVAPAANLTSQQSAALKLAWDNVLRGYEDLTSTPPDVKGDTSRLEGHMEIGRAHV